MPEKVSRAKPRLEMMGQEEGTMMRTRDAAYSRELHEINVPRHQLRREAVDPLCSSR